jgi:hypothetical protein
LQKGGSGRRRAGQISSFDAGRYRRRAKTTYPGRTDLGLESPSYKNSCPFVSIRGSKTPAAKTLQDRSRAGKPELHEIRVHSRSFVVQYDNTRKATSGQISGWKARATKIRAHSCPFVVQKHPQRRPCRTDLGLESPSCKNSCPFAFIRGSKSPAAKTLAGQISGWKARATKIRVHSRSFVVQKHPQRRPCRTDLGLESPSYKNSCPFAFIRGSIRQHSQSHFRADLGLESPSYRNSCPFVFIRGSKSPAAKTLQDRSRAGKHELQKFVSIRVHSWFKTTRSGDPAEQISGWKARATKIRAHSCPFVVQNDPQRRPFRTDLGLESPSCKNSCPFVSIRGSKTPRSEDPSGQISG